MGQVPHYLILGAGRLATHMLHYLRALSLPCQQWQRQQGFAVLDASVETATHLLLLIKDDAIAEFVAAHPRLQSKTLMHCSGSLVIPGVPSAHPLMTFNEPLESLAWYQTIPFVIEQEGPSFSQLLPGLTNPHYALPRDLKALYHSGCVLSGNFTTLLWQQFQALCEQQLQLPKEIIQPYQQQIFQNLMRCPEQALTGPLARNDTQTLAANLAALADHPYQAVYQAFVDAYQATQVSEKFNEHS